MTADDLARAVRERRTELGFSKAKLARTAGLGVNTIYFIENSRQTRYRDDTLSLIDKALGWEIGVADRLLFQRTDEGCTCSCHQLPDAP